MENTVYEDSFFQTDDGPWVQEEQISASESTKVVNTVNSQSAEKDTQNTGSRDEVSFKESIPSAIHIVNTEIVQSTATANTNGNCGF